MTADISSLGGTQGSASDPQPRSGKAGPLAATLRILSGKTVSVGYSKGGASVPGPETKVEVMKAQAQKVSERL